MANYRPRSLNELGNLYDKSLEAENEIKKSSSKLEDKPVQSATAFMPDEEALPMKKTPDQIAADEIAAKIGDFAKNFGTINTEVKMPVAIATVQSKPRAKKNKADEGASDEKADKKKSEPSKPKLIRNSERTNLFEDYKKVMDDDDDDGNAEPGKTKRGLRRKKGAEKASQKSEAELKAEAIVDNVFNGNNAEKAVEEEKSEPQEVIREEADEEISEVEIAKEEESAPEEEKAPRKNPVVQLVLTVMLLCVLLSSIGVGCIKAFSGADSDKAFSSDNYIYTAKRDYYVADISNGSLVITDNKYPVAGDVVAYKKDDGSYAFARFDTALNEESAIINDGYQQMLILNKNLRGVVSKTIPVAGLFVSVAVSYFLPVMGLMLLLIVLLTALIIFVSKSGKPKAEKIEEDEDEDEDYSEYEEEYADQQEDYSDESDEAMTEEESDYNKYEEESEEDDFESLFTLG